ncbi:unnamed protein product [Microthlaspi erraticum]|uniref:Uncharacterized protein n=1 Tax=Microthlaspi erraticum TaxID=1685480 RepID=A0A6D2J2S6_9BRAS|nr:unnamed protein product [Microthlaspi erraticum]
MSNGQGGYNKGYYNYKSNPAMSYRNTDVANPQDQVYPQQQAARSSQAFPHQPPQPAPSQENELKAMLKQLLQGQADGVVDTSKKLAEINSKIENLNTRVYSLENHASSVAAATKQGQLPEIVAAEAPGVQIDQPEVQAPTVAIHTSPVELARQARSAARSSPTLARSSPTSSVRNLFCLILTNRLPLPRLAYLVKFNLLTSPTFLPKVKDQGKFTLPCTLGHLEIDNALVDSGASINLISLSMAEKLGIAGALQRPTTSIMFGDATSKSPLGVFKNYHLKIGECIIQTDLTVMEMEEEKDLPLLLGTPFLSTVGASIDFHKQEVILHKVVKERVDKEPRVGKDKVERGPRIEKPRLERARVEKPRSDRPRADRLVQAPCVLDEEAFKLCLMSH